MQGYFGVGLEKSSKPMNAGNLFRTAHAFGASFLFTVSAVYSVNKAKSDTSAAPRNIPWYDFSSAGDLKLPGGCVLVGVEFVEDALELPVFRHPSNAAYILGPEIGSLSPEILQRCRHVVKIPSSFCLNVATTGAIVLYDRHPYSGKLRGTPGQHYRRVFAAVGTRSRRSDPAKTKKIA